MMNKYRAPTGKGQHAIGVETEIAEMVKVIWQMDEINPLQNRSTSHHTKHIIVIPPLVRPGYPAPRRNLTIPVATHGWVAPLKVHPAVVR